MHSSLRRIWDTHDITRSILDIDWYFLSHVQLLIVVLMALIMKAQLMNYVMYYVCIYVIDGRRPSFLGRNGK